MTGKPKLVGKTLSPNFSLKRQGVFVEYYPNGHRKLMENYDNGSQTGDVTRFYTNGRVYYVSNYDKGKKLNIISEANDSTGVATVTDGKGAWTEYSDDFKFVKGKGSIVNGLKQGEWQGAPNDSVTYTCTYKQGTSVTGVSHTKSGKEYHFTNDMAQPGPKGGIEKFYQLLARNRRYPAEAKERNVQGKVWSTFTVEKDGRLTNIRILQGIGYGCNEEVQRVLNLSSPWEPEYQYGIPVRVKYQVPISFALQVEYH
jgi:TonB family protein